MEPIWTERQFVGGTVALDLTNTVCYRGESRQFDKITDTVRLAGFVTAALALSDAGHSAASLGECDFSPVALALTRAIREAVDALFRPVARGAAIELEPFRFLLSTHRDVLDKTALRVGPAGIEIDPAGKTPFAAVLTQSALQLAGSSELARIKICPNCHWLFLDRSKNASRIWCDMQVCGNLAKAARFQQRRSRYKTA